jgi:hypothetical protein
LMSPNRLAWYTMYRRSASHSRNECVRIANNKVV